MRSRSPHFSDLIPCMSPQHRLFIYTFLDAFRLLFDFFPPFLIPLYPFLSFSFSFPLTTLDAMIPSR